MSTKTSLKLSFEEMLNIAHIAVQHQSHYNFFKDGAEHRAAIAAFRQQEAGCDQEAVITALADSLQFDSHICYFDDPCDPWAA